MATTDAAHAAALSAQKRLESTVGESSFRCLMALLQFILADPILRSVIITFLDTCKAEILVEKALLELAVAQLKITLSIIEAEISALGAVFSIAEGLGNRFPLGVFARCPLTASIATTAQKGIKSHLPAGGSNGVVNAITAAKTTIRDLQYKVARMNLLLDQTNAAIERSNLFVSQITAMEDFINALATFSGQFSLPLT